ncbi:MAG TPA: VanZ family protein, partial [Candidatus Binatia bacterium]|nr:VanZ family protein [Candidatus Binatia bacterium]
ADEFHQAFVASRDALVTDIIIDSAGAILGLLIGAVFARRRFIKIEKTTVRS